ncbi:ABC1 family-domain-containing protein [Obelidium mucronatum]|nr:ABC1 family-domain-containing protein [Obelidium mucronatum]
MLLFAPSDNAPSPFSVAVSDPSASAPVRGLWFVSILTWSLQAAGPAFIKLAQYASSREDLFSFEVCQILGQLQDRGYPHSMGWTRRAFRIEDVVVLSGSDAHVNSNAQSLQLADLFDEFDEVPVGVGAIAQVYKARLRQSQKIVAVKVLHPSAFSTINKDLIILKFLTETLTYLFPNTLQWLSLPDEVAVFSAMMRSQTDLRTEANNLLQFRRHFKDWSISNSDGGGAVIFPEPILSSRSILVEEFIDAIPISRFLSVPHTISKNDDLVVLPIHESARLRSSPPVSGTPFDIQLAKIGMRSFVKMLLVDNFCHADLHPGNITVCFVPPPPATLESEPSATQLPTSIQSLADLEKLSDREFLETMLELHRLGYQPRLVYLDAGLVSTLSPKNLVNLNDLLVKIVQFDGHGVASLLVERQRIASASLEDGASGSGDVVDFDGFTDKMSGLLHRIRDSSLKLSTVSFSWILRQVFSMVRTHHVRLEGDFANVGVAVMLVEGVGRQLDPGVDLLEEVRGVVIREWVLAVGDLWAVRAVLEVYAYSKQIAREVVGGKWGFSK